jgi:hypothetical protein
MKVNGLLTTLNKMLVIFLLATLPAGVAYASWGSCMQVPELDPGQLASGIAIFVGMASIVLERRRARRR